MKKPKKKTPAKSKEATGYWEKLVAEQSLQVSLPQTIASTGYVDVDFAKTASSVTVAPPSPSAAQMVEKIQKLIDMGDGSPAQTSLIIGALNTAVTTVHPKIDIDQVHALFMGYASKVLLGQAFDPHVAKNAKGAVAIAGDPAYPGPLGVPDSIQYHKGGTVSPPQPPSKSLGPLPMLFMSPPKKVAPVDHFAEAAVDHFEEASTQELKLPPDLTPNSHEMIQFITKAIASMGVSLPPAVKEELEAKKELEGMGF